MDLAKFIRDIPDFPKPGIIFKDITPLLNDPKAFKAAVNLFVEQHRNDVGKIDRIVGIESRGFIFGSALAYALGAGFVPIRKEGKLPFETFKASYSLEYGEAVLEIHADALRKGSRVIVIDDVLATGGTVKAALKLLNKFGVKVDGIYFLIELLALNGRKKLGRLPVEALIRY